MATSICVKYLGMLIDNKLKFHEHTSVTIAKANRISICINNYLTSWKAFKSEDDLVDIQL